MAPGAVENADAQAPIDDCWNRIGIRGDRSCPQLTEFALCANCPVFEQAAAALLDRPLNHTDGGNAQLARRARSNPEKSYQYIANQPDRLDGTDVDPATAHSVLVFRIADEWLALSTSAMLRVDETRTIHSLPHRRNRVVLGLVNVHGALTVAVSLVELLQLDRTNTGEQMSRNGYARMLVATHRGAPVAFPVDEVEGVFRFSLSTLMPVPTTLARAAAVHTCGVFAWRDTTIGLLDTSCIFESLARTLR